MWSIWLQVFQSGEVQVYIWMFQCWNIVLLTRLFDVTKYTILTPLSLLSWHWLSFLAVSLKMFSLHTFALKSQNRIFIWYLQKWLKTCSNTSQKHSFESSFFYSLGACKFTIMVLHQWPLRTIYDILSLTNSPLLNADTILWRKKDIVPNWWFSFPFLN